MKTNKILTIISYNYHSYNFRLTKGRFDHNPNCYSEEFGRVNKNNSMIIYSFVRL